MPRNIESTNSANLLYYPYINLPRKNWTARTLLYYDEIGSIVPIQYMENPGDFDPYMQTLVREQLVTPINPLQVIDKPKKVIVPFIDYMNDKKFNVSKRRTSFSKQTALIHKEKISAVNIHTGKFDSELFYQLRHAGLAKKHGNYWYEVEKQTADELLTFLASIVAKKIQFTPTTDKIGAYTYAKLKKGMKKKDSKRKLILKELIPLPEHIDLMKLRSFKDKHRELLYKFRTTVEILVSDSNAKKGSKNFKERVIQMKEQKKELTARMTENFKGKYFYGAICNLTSATAQVFTLDMNSIPGVVGVSASLAGAIYYASQIESPESVYDATGMKYIALLDRRLQK